MRRRRSVPGKPVQAEQQNHAEQKLPAEQESRERTR